MFHFWDGGGLKNGYIIPGTDTAEEAISKRCRDRGEKTEKEKEKEEEKEEEEALSTYKSLMFLPLSSFLEPALLPLLFLSFPLPSFARLSSEKEEREGIAQFDTKLLLEKQVVEMIVKPIENYIETLMIILFLRCQEKTSETLVFLSFLLRLN